MLMMNITTYFHIWPIHSWLFKEKPRWNWVNLEYLQQISVLVSIDA